MIVLSFKGNHFLAHCTFAFRHIPQKAGFSWDQQGRVWHTREIKAAMQLKEYADESANVQLAKYCIQICPYPLFQMPPLMKHQLTALEFVLSRNRAYLGLAPGLGKTAVAALTAQTLGVNPTYICPPFLVNNVHAEFERWTPNQWVDIIPDTRLESFKPSSQPLLFVDEAHRFKNATANRTKYLFGARGKPGIVDSFNRRVYLSGTPMPNRPMELFPVLHKEAPETIGFKDSFEFGMRYCSGYQGKWGWDFSGASHVEELAAGLKPFMLRMDKDVLDLPPRTEEIFVLSGDQPLAVLQVDREISSRYTTTEDLIRAQLTKSQGSDLAIATYRRLLGVHKVKYALPFIKDILEESDDSILVYGCHKATIAALEEGLSDFSPLVITGDTPTHRRQAVVDAFQRPEGKHRLMIGNYQAMGVGFTLTKARRVIFCEYSWVPGENDQAADRAHRIGQDKSVLITYLVFRNSIDKRVIESLISKRKTISKL